MSRSHPSAEDAADIRERITARLVNSLFGKPLVSNAIRGSLVEAIVAEALEPEWRWCADGWGPFDFEGPGGIGLEVKQSAARQAWHDVNSKACAAKFDIAERTGFWDEPSKWVERPGRAAAIYVFAHHPVFDPARADHRDPFQWDFYLAPASSLPTGRKSISLSGIRELDGVHVVSFSNLRDGVAASLRAYQAQTSAAVTAHRMIIRG